MIWGVGLVVLVIALLIPIVTIALHAPAGRASGRRAEGVAAPVNDELLARVVALEDEVEALGRELRELREETQFLQSLLEQPQRRATLSPPDG
jgi:hypothetical protein